MSSQLDQTVEEFRKLLEVSEVLMGPEGCPWDREQTLISIRHSILEEACEVIDAIDNQDPNNLLEELGDILYNVIFFCKLVEKEYGLFMKDVILMIREKLIARHPHVFGEVVLHDAEAVIEQWEKLKSKEHSKKSRKSVMDGIPKSLPALSQAEKMISKMSKLKYRLEQASELFETEEELGVLLWKIASLAKTKGIHPEIALRKELTKQETAFRKWEEDEQISDPS